MMSESTFTVEIDGRTVLVDPERQEVSILDAEGAVLFHERIQVAAGSVQGLFEEGDPDTFSGTGAAGYDPWG